MMNRSRTLHLTKSDIHELLENPNDDIRAEVAGKVAKEIGTEGLDDSERRIANDILRMMVCDAAVRVRVALVESLRYTNQVPHDIAMELARDVELVAVPMLESSPIFTDADLIELVKNGTGPKHLAIASRGSVSEDLSQALVEAGSNVVVSKLVSNPDAEISEATLNLVVDRFGEDETVNGPLAERTDLPITIAERLVALVSNEIRNRLVKSGKVAASAVEDLMGETRERATVKLAGDWNRDEEIEKLVAQLSKSGRLTPTIILRAICSGEMRFFEEAMANRAGIEHTKAWLLIHDRGQLGLRALYKEAEMPMELYKPIRIAIDVYKSLMEDGDGDGRAVFKKKMVERILSQYQDMEDADIEYFLKRLALQAAAAVDEVRVAG